jgi:hypothetical protein
MIFYWRGCCFFVISKYGCREQVFISLDMFDLFAACVECTDKYPVADKQCTPGRSAGDPGKFS